MVSKLETGLETALVSVLVLRPKSRSSQGLLTCKKYREKSKENPEVPGDAEESVKPIIETETNVLNHLKTLHQTYKLKEANILHQT